MILTLTLVVLLKKNRIASVKMNITVILISALALVAQSRANTDSNECISAKTCGQCIQIGPQCVWCKDPDFNPSRCDHQDSLEWAGCTALGIENPRGTITIDKNKPVTKRKIDVEEKLMPEEINQIQPQKVTLNLRSGEAQQFMLTFKRAEDNLNAQPDSLSSEVILENSRLPEGVSISFVSYCKNGVSEKGENGRKCSNIYIGGEVKFDVEIIAKGCPSNGTSETIKIKPSGFTEEVEVVLNFICECECHKDKIPNSPACTDGNGMLECGVCRCNEGRLGRLCEMRCRDEVQTEDLDANCRMGYEMDICSNNGECICGMCECRKRDNPEERYSGKFCECDNFNCDRSNNKLCGGHGRCECRRCICDANYAGSACDCPLDTSTCMASNKQICNGRGVCVCGVCTCTDPKFQGSTCEICPTCPGVCAEHKDCVECRAFHTGDKKDTCETDCGHFSMKMVKKKDLLQPFDHPYITHCKERDANDRWFFFSYALNNDGNDEVHVAETEK